MHPYYNALLLPIVIGSAFLLALLVLTCIRISRQLDQRRWDRVRWNDATGTIRPSIRRRVRMPAFSRRERRNRRIQRAADRDTHHKFKQIIRAEAASRRREQA